jgi:RTA1 like protein
MPYVIQNLFILLPPALFAATIYMCLGRVIKLVHADHLSPIRPRRLTWIFVGGDFLSFYVQGGSAAFSVMADKNALYPMIAEAMVVGGLGIQLLSFCLFGLTALTFHRRLKRAPTTASDSGDQEWRVVMRMLYSVSALIIVRSIFRIVEYVLGSTGYPLTHEWTLYLFDTIPMLAVSVVFFLRYPTCLVQTKHDGVALEEMTNSRDYIMPK